MDRQPPEELYAVSPDRFVEARNALVEELKGSGNLRRAGEIAKLRKPTVAAWALNQMARRRGGDVRDLLALGSELAEAQRRAMTGGGRENLTRLAGRRASLVDRLVREAAEALRLEGGTATPSQLTDVANTLLAVATDPEGGERLRTGTLDRPLPAPAGFGGVLTATSDREAELKPRPARKARASRQTPEGARARPRADDARQVRERERLALITQAADRASDRAERLRAEGDRAEETARAARREADLSAKEADRARREAGRPGRGAERAAGEAARLRERAMRARTEFDRRFGRGPAT